MFSPHIYTYFLNNFLLEKVSERGHPWDVLKDLKINKQVIKSHNTDLYSGLTQAWQEETSAVIPMEFPSIGRALFQVLLVPIGMTTLHNSNKYHWLNKTRKQFTPWMELKPLLFLTLSLNIVWWYHLLEYSSVIIRVIKGMLEFWQNYSYITDGFPVFQSAAFVLV